MKNKYFVFIIFLFFISFKVNVFALENNIDGFYSENGNEYYYIDGVMQKGIVEIDGKKYFLGYLTGILKTNTLVRDTEDNMYYTNENGVVQTGWQEIGKDKYYFDENGIMQKGIIDIDGESYFFGYLTGILKTDTLVRDTEDNMYYTNENGVVQTGWQEIGKDKYYFDENGVMQKGITKIDGKKYFLGCLTGILKTDTLVRDTEDNMYYTNENGIVQTGWQEIGKDKYYFDENGVMQKGIVEIDGEKYFLGCLTGILKIDTLVRDTEDNMYYTNENGVVQTGWQEIGKDKYYFDENGVMQKGIIDIEGESYFFGYLTGVLKTNTFVNDIYGNTYHTTNEGIVQKGIIKIDGKEYFLGYLTGILKRNTFVNDLYGNTYHTTNEGIVQKGITEINGEKYFLGCLTGILKRNTFVKDLLNNIYYTNSEGIIQTGLQTIDGVDYSFSSNGILNTGYQEINGKTYYFYLNGTLAKGVVKIQGERNYFDFTTGELLKRNVKSIIDVSYAQGNIDWDTLWNSGTIDGAIIRVGYGTSKVDDPVLDNYFYQNVRACERLGIPYSVYIYGYAQTTYAAEKEANFVGSILRNNNLNLSYPVFYDAEISYWNGLNYTSSTYSNTILSFSNKLKEYGYQTGVYGSVSWLDNVEGRLNSPVIRSFPLWVAQYYKICEYSGTYIGWQYTSSGSLPGINGDVDMSIFY